MKKIICITFFTLLLVIADKSFAMADPHYNELGFFDIHVCNWPEQPPFFLALFSTYLYKDVEKIEVFDPLNRPITELNLSKYRIINTKKGQKRAFLKHVAIPKGSKSGWYSVKTTMKNGQQAVAKDYVILEKLPRATELTPADNTEDLPLPKKLVWKAVPGAKYYQVFIRDFWNDEKTIYTSPLLQKPELILPKELLKAGGWYGWRVHSRDTNEHVLLGDFNHGSLTREYRFSVVDE